MAKSVPRTYVIGMPWDQKWVIGLLSKSITVSLDMAFWTFKNPCRQSTINNDILYDVCWELHLIQVRITLSRIFPHKQSNPRRSNGIARATGFFQLVKSRAAYKPKIEHLQSESVIDVSPRLWLGDSIVVIPMSYSNPTWFEEVSQYTHTHLHTCIYIPGKGTHSSAVD